jgi:Transposase DDE domain group 1
VNLIFPLFDGCFKCFGALTLTSLCYVEVSMRRSPRNVKIAFSHAGLTHYGGILFLSEFSRMLQLRRFLTRHLRYPRRNHDYELSQIILSLVYPIILGLDRLETASLLRSNGTFQYLTGLPSYPSPQSLRRFLLQAAPDFREQLQRVNDYLLRHFIHRPDHRSRLILDMDSTIVTVFGHQEGAAMGYNPRYRGKRSYDPLLCLEANSSFLWDVELRRGDAGTWAGSEETFGLLFSLLSFRHSGASRAGRCRLRLRARVADAGSAFGPIRRGVARMTRSLKQALKGLSYEPMNPRWEIAEFEHHPQDWHGVVS